MRLSTITALGCSERPEATRSPTAMARGDLGPAVARSLIGLARSPIAAPTISAVSATE